MNLNIFFRKNFGKLDWLLVAISLLLAMFGLIILYSLEANLGQGFTLFNKQLLLFGGGLLVLGFSITVNYQQLKPYAAVIYFFGLVLLITVLFFGQQIRGVRGWFVIGPLSFQPVEFVKLFAVIFFAKYFSERGNVLYQNQEFLKSLVLILPYLVLLVWQPDLGSAFIVAVIWLLMMLFTKVRARQIITLFFLALFTLVVSWNFLADYQQNRLKTFIDPTVDPQGAGYNIRQALTAVGSGQWLGKGLGEGTQSQLRFLPENHSDFIFAVIAEEFGFVGASLLLVLYLILFWRLIKITKSAKDQFGFFLTVGIMVFVATQTFMNISMNLSLFPVTGIPLPLVSQGGSSLWSILLALGLVQSVKTNE